MTFDHTRLPTGLSPFPNRFQSPVSVLDLRPEGGDPGGVAGVLEVLGCLRDRPGGLSKMGVC